MADENQNDDTDGTTDDSGTDTGATGAGKTLTQADADKLAAKVRAEATRKAERDIKAYLAAEKEQHDLAAMDEVTRAKAEVTQARAEAAAVKAEAAAERQAAKVERRLLAAGVPDTALSRAVRTISLEADASDDDIVAEIEALKTEIPGLFTPTATGTAKPPPATTPPPPKGGPATGTPNDIAKQQLIRMGVKPRSEAA